MNLSHHFDSDHRPNMENACSGFDSALDRILKAFYQKEFDIDSRHLVKDFSDQLEKLHNIRVKELSQAKQIVEFFRSYKWLQLIQAVRTTTPALADELLVLKNQLLVTYEQITEKQTPTESHRWMINAKKQ